MNTVKQIRQLATIHIIGGLVAVVVGLVSQLLVESGPDKLGGNIVNNLVTLIVFGMGFFLLNSFGSSNVYQQLVKGEGNKGQPLVRLSSQPAPLARSFGRNRQILDIGLMLCGVVVIVVVTLIFPENPTNIALGGFVGGWLIGNALSQFRFASKTTDQQLLQGRLFYFNHAGVGPRTQVSYFQVDPNKDSNKVAVEETQSRLASLNAPGRKPLVTRRTTRLGSPNSSPVERSVPAPLRNPPVKKAVKPIPPDPKGEK